MSSGNGFHRSDSGGISPLHPYYSRDYRSTNHIKLRSRRTGVFPEVQVCVFECFSGHRRVFQIHEKSWFFTTYGSKKIVHGPNPLNGPYSAHILWKFMIFWPNEWSRRILCGKMCTEYVQLNNNSKIYPKCTKTTDWMGQIWTAYFLCTRITLETTALRVI